MTTAKLPAAIALGLIILVTHVRAVDLSPATAPATAPQTTPAVREVEYGRVGDVSLKLDVSVPDGAGPFPVVVIVHGGGWGGGDKRRDITPLFEPLSRGNFTWFSINYRLAPQDRWPACFDDVRTAIRWVKAHAAEYKGDPRRVALVGHSAGGQLACLAAVLAEEDTRVQAVVGLAPVTDLERDSETRGGLSKSLQDLLGRPKELTDEVRPLLRDLSPITHVKAGLPPFLIVHGDADKTVPLKQTLDFRAKLEGNGVRCDVITVKGAPHAVTQWEKFDPSYKQQTVAWLAEVLDVPEPKGPVEQTGEPRAGRAATVPATRTATAPQADAVVAADGSGQYKTVQEAVNASPQSNPPKPWVVYIKAGTYRELVYVQREKRFLRLVGEDAQRTVITFDLFADRQGLDGKPIGTFRTPTAVIDADDFTAENLTFENAAGRKGQALAVRVDGDAVVFRNCRFLGWQDTIFINRGRQYFEGCYVEGAVDFIFGGATAFFEKCHIHCKGKGYITAASTPSFQPYGYVFSNCKITGESPDVKSYLGRPWRPFAGTVFLNTEMSDVVHPAGWHNWDKPDREKTVRYGEFNSTGPGADPAKRAPWAKRLTEAEAASYTRAMVLGGADGWDPNKPENRR